MGEGVAIAVAACGQTGDHRIGVLGIGQPDGRLFDRAHYYMQLVVPLLETAGIAHHGGNVVPSGKCLVENRVADMAGGTEQNQFHGISPCG
ncbi:hypothetical protein GCM10007898_35980 [Dyella flagellata]|uniref:Uncharacterized protein n=1 Tax=Dyella flagellata TaxID=1867833 RepID=A0ABQ5XG13_9GAMM|nr:hypothetical protein GCM10007898_35980 [Dyella flagellata]